MTSTTRHVALVYDATLPYDLKVIEGVAAYVQEVRNWNVYIEESALGQQRLPDLRTWHGDGVIADFDHPRIAQQVQGIEIPVVGFGGGYGWYDVTSGIPYYATNNWAIAELAAGHLVDRGFRRFAFCGYPPSPINGWSEERATAFARYVGRLGFPCSIHTGRQKTARNWAGVERELGRWLGSLERPVGLLAATDKRARQVLEVCKTLGLQVPEEVAVVGVDNDEMLCRLATPPLSSVKQGTTQIGYRAAAALEAMMAGRAPRRLPQIAPPGAAMGIVPPEGIVCRRSSDTLAIEDAEMAGLVRYIAEHACEGLHVAEVAQQGGVSRSTLEARFRALLGRSVHAEIRHVQIERAKELIRSSDLPLKRVAQLSGFSSVQYMTHLFRRLVDQTPAGLRRSLRTRG